jgi:RNA polymerase sigma factor (sigma-70 family)
MNDSELLRRFSEQGDQAAFRELVAAHIDLVYAAASRQVGSDGHRAEDICQQVFVDLARKAGQLKAHPCLAGWLYACTRFTAINTIRVEQRRAAREQSAHLMSDPTPDTSDLPWENIRTVIDDALQELDEEDRDMIVLRFFGQEPFAAIAARLRVSENAAQKRLTRALDALSLALGRRGITSMSAATLAVALPHAAVAAPGALAAATAAMALGSGSAVVGTVAAASSSTVWWVAGAKVGLLAGAACVLGFAGGNRSAAHRSDAVVAAHEKAFAERTAELEARLQAQTQRANAADADTARLLAAVQSAQAAVAARPPKIAPAGGEPAPVKPASFLYVLRGDTGMSIAQRTNVSTQALAKANPGVNFARLMVGQKINIPDGAPPYTPPSSGGNSTPPGPVGPEDPADGVYRVQIGDTGNSIASKAHLTFEQLAALNPGVDWNRLTAGTAIKTK